MNVTADNTYKAEATANNLALTSRKAQSEDIDKLLRLENECFASDRISRRSFKHHIQSSNAQLLIIDSNSSACIAYGLVLFHRGTRLARLYSLAVSSDARGLGVAQFLLDKLEADAADAGRHYMRLEVSKENTTAIALYTKNGYKIFGKYNDYYDDHSDALRMQKRIRQMREKGIQHNIDWYPQGTEFTCGPSALIMAMSSMNPMYEGSLVEELNIWREATTIFMTSGHGGCHPFGLALAAKNRGFGCSVWINTDTPLFIDGVRSEHKKEIMTVVHEDFLQKCVNKKIDVHYEAISINSIREQLNKKNSILTLVSTYRLDGKKAPHWVVVTGMDNDCLFVHDPSLDVEQQTSLDCQNVPIAYEDFEKMTQFGTQRLRATIAVTQTLKDTL